MKLYTILIALCVTCFFSTNTQTLQAQTYAHAGEYMSGIANEYAAFNNDMWRYINAVAHSRKARKIENKRQDLLETTRNLKKQIEAFPAYEGDVSLRDSTVLYVDMCYKVLNGDYEEILNLEEIAEQSYDLMEAYMLAVKKADEKLDEATERLQKTQETFAKKHNIELVSGEDNEVSKKLSKAGEVNAYANEMYLVFFKSYKQEAYLLDALATDDLNAIAQNQGTLESYATEGLEKLDSLGTYLGDHSLKVICEQMLRFFQKEATKEVPGFIEFLLKKQQLESMQKAIDAKKQSELKQPEIDAYNKAIKEFNTSVNAYNKTNNLLNDKRGKLLNSWNEAYAKFIDKHVPK